RTEIRPTVLDVLHGRPPADGPPVSVELTPGQVFRKHNTHSAVLQQLLVDVTGQELPDLMRTLVFEPLSMTHSSYDYAHPELSGLPVALGHEEDGSTIEGGWRNRSTQAAGGLWTTAADLAAVAI